METPTFIESYQTGDYSLCDDLITQLDTYLDSEDFVRQNSNLVMIGEQNYNGVLNRKDTSINFSWLHAEESDKLRDRLNILLNEYLQKYNSKYPGFQNLSCISIDMKVQRTEPKGGFHRWHVEHGANNTCLSRVLVWTLYLNDIPEGEGETEFLEYGVKVTPKKGLLSFFPAGWTHVHRGNAVYSTTKYIATGWFQVI